MGSLDWENLDLKIGLVIEKPYVNYFVFRYFFNKLSSSTFENFYE